MPGTRCAAAVCKNSLYTTRTLDDDDDTRVKYHRFPSNLEIRNKWIRLCQLSGKCDTKFMRVCSVHFTDDDYERDLRAELLNIPTRRILKAYAVPSLLMSPVSESNSALISKRTVQDTNRIARQERRASKKIVAALLDAATSTQIAQERDYSALDLQDKNSTTESSGKCDYPALNLQGKNSTTESSGTYDYPALHLQGKDSKTDSSRKCDFPALELQDKVFKTESSRKYELLVKQNEELRNRNKYLESEVKVATKQNEELVNKINFWEREVKVVNAKLNHLRSKSMDLAPLKRTIQQLKKQGAKNELVYKKACQALGKVFTKSQLKFLVDGKKHVVWDDRSMSVALTLRKLSVKSYAYLRKHLNYPLPGPSTVRRWESSGGRDRIRFHFVEDTSEHKKMSENEESSTILEAISEYDGESLTVHEEISKNEDKNDEGSPAMQYIIYENEENNDEESSKIHVEISENEKKND